MGWCPEFGVQICAGCGSSMVPEGRSCVCADCGAVCHGRFASCEEVWVRGPRPLERIGPDAEDRSLFGYQARHNVADEVQPDEAAVEMPPSVDDGGDLLATVGVLRGEVAALRAALDEQTARIEALGHELPDLVGVAVVLALKGGAARHGSVAELGSRVDRLRARLDDLVGPERDDVPSPGGAASASDPVADDESDDGASAEVVELVHRANASS